MKKSIILFCLCVWAFLSSAIYADSSASIKNITSEKNVTAHKANEKGLLYRLEGDGTYPSYLFGTVHIIDKKRYVMPPKVLSALAQSEALFLELDMDDPAQLMKVVTASLLPDGQTLESLMSPEDWNALKKFWQQQFASESEKFARMKPFFVLSYLIQNLIGEFESYDLNLLQLATKQGIPIHGLEAVEEQIAVIDSIPMKLQIEQLMDIVSSKQQAIDDMDKLITAYLNEDIPALHVMMEEYYASESQMIESFLSKRNQNWVPRIIEQAKQTPTLFAFGAGHLGGDDGVVNLLREKGYSVIPIGAANE